MDHFDKNRKYFLQMPCNSNNNDIKMMPCSPFYGFKNNVKSKTMIRAPLMSKVGDSIKYSVKMLHVKKSCQHLIS